MKTHNLFSKIISLALSLALILAAVPAEAFAEEGGLSSPGEFSSTGSGETSGGNKTPGENIPPVSVTSPGAITVTAFEPPDPASLNYAAPDAPKTQDKLPLPGTLTATLEGEGKTETASVPVTWTGDKTYAGEPGAYIFTAAPDEIYTAAEGVPSPVITVTVAEAAVPIVTITITGESEYGNALYLNAGAAVTDEALLAGVSAADENGRPVAVTVTSADGLDRANPRPRFEDAAEAGPVPKPYAIKYEAKHPVTGEIFTAARDCYVTAGITALAVGQAGPFTVEATYGGDTGTGGWNYNNVTKTLTITVWGDYTIRQTAPGATDSRIAVTSEANVKLTLDGINIDVSGTNGACAFDADGAGSRMARGVPLSLRPAVRIRLEAAMAGPAYGFPAAKNLP